MKYRLLIFFIINIVIALFIIIPLKEQLSDCRFEVNDLQVRLYRLQELSDYVPAMEQLLPSLVLAQMKAATEMIRQKRWKEYERYEQPLIERR